MVTVELDPILNCLLLQISADLDVPPTDLAKILLESALVMEGTRS